MGKPGQRGGEREAQLVKFSSNSLKAAQVPTNIPPIPTIPPTVLLACISVICLASYHGVSFMCPLDQPSSREQSFVYSIVKFVDPAKLRCELRMYVTRLSHVVQSSLESQALPK